MRYSGIKQFRGARRARQADVRSFSCLRRCRPVYYGDFGRGQRGRLFRKCDSIRYMRKYVGKFLLLLVMAALPVAVWGQKVAFEVNAPRVVAVGEIFRIEYVTDSKPQDFKGLSLKEWMYWPDRRSPRVNRYPS